MLCGLAQTQVKHSEYCGIVGEGRPTKHQTKALFPDFFHISRQRIDRVEGAAVVDGSSYMRKPPATFGHASYFRWQHLTFVTPLNSSNPFRDIPIYLLSP